MFFSQSYIQRDRTPSALLACPSWCTNNPGKIGKIGFASRNIIERREALEGLYGIMTDWDGGSRAMLRSLRTKCQDILVGPGVVDDTELADVERDLVYHYISTFRDVFGCAPLLPHAL